VKALLRAVLFVALLFLAAVGLDAAYGVASRHDRETKVNWVFGMHGTTPEYVLLGSSRGAVTVDAGLLNSLLGVRGINISVNGAGYSELALLWDVFLQKNKPKRLLLEVDLFGFDTTVLSHPFHEYYYLPYLANPRVASSLRENYRGRAFIWQYVPLFKYAEFNDRIGLKSILHVVHRAPPGFDSLGSELRSGTMNDSLIARLRDTTYGVDSARLASLERILNAARSDSVRVTLFSAPLYVAGRKRVTNAHAILAIYRALAARYGAEFLDLDESAIEGNKANFYNPEHLNRSGARLFTQLLGDSLRSAWALTQGRAH
jgi:hypothetical protein